MSVSEEVLHFCLLQVPKYQESQILPACTLIGCMHCMWVYIVHKHSWLCVSECLEVQVGGGKMYQVLYILTPALYQLYLMSLIKIHEFLMQIN